MGGACALWAGNRVAVVVAVAVAGDDGPNAELMVCSLWIESRGDHLAVDLGSGPFAELAIDAIVIVDEELCLLIERGVPDLLLDPGQGWMVGHVDVHNLAAPEFHDDEDVVPSQ